MPEHQIPTTRHTSTTSTTNTAGMTSLREARLSAERTAHLPLSRVRIPNPDALIPPGYYAEGSGPGSPCTHCGAAGVEHLGAARFCPVPPLEFMRTDRRDAA